MSSIKIQTTMEELVFSCHVPTVMKVVTDMSGATFVLKDAETETEVIRLSLDAYDGTIEIYDLCSAIEQYMNDNSKAFARFILGSESVDDGEEKFSDSITFGVIYCSHSMNSTATEFTDRFFLSTVQQKLTYPSVNEEVSFFVPSSQTVTADYTIIIDDGESKRPVYFTEELTVEEGIHSLCLSYDCMVEKANIDTSSSIILSASVTMGDRDFTVFYSQSAPSCDFYFRNMFGVFEHCPISAKTICKTSTERSVASVNGVSSFYDQKDSQENAVETEPLSKGIAQWLAQLAISPSVYLCPTNAKELSAMTEILITESTVEVADNNEEMNTVKFTWKTKDSRPSFSAHAQQTPVYNSVFSKTYM